jgi:hypothetical protein
MFHRRNAKGRRFEDISRKPNYRPSFGRCSFCRCFKAKGGFPTNAKTSSPVPVYRRRRRIRQMVGNILYGAFSSSSLTTAAAKI